MFEVTTLEYRDMLSIHYATKTPLYVYGAPGIGKSAIPRQVFKETAKARGREFIEWNDMTEEIKMDAMDNPSKYFVFTDFRLGQVDTTDLKGIPNMTNTKLLEYMPLAWVRYYANPEADGVIFFDEMNLAPPVVAGQAYQIINDRVVSDIRISDNVFLFGAGNRATDKAHVFDMPFPLRDRFSELQLNVNDDEWCDWAFQNGINTHLIAFIKWKPETLFAPADGSEDKGSTPRGIVRASKLLKENNQNVETPMAHALVSVALGEAFATEFTAYAQIASKIDLDALMAKPESVVDFNSPDKWFAVCGLLGEHLPRLKGKDPKIGKLFAVAHCLPDEFCVVALNMIRNSFNSNANFKKALTKYPRFKDLINEVARFAIN